jgi:hypothetical protein
MARPLYETPENLTAEEQAMWKFTKADFRKVPRSYPFDFIVMAEGGESIVAGVEVKVRNYEMRKLPDLFISAQKLWRMASFHQTTGIKTYLLVQALDGLFYVLIDPVALNGWSFKGYVRISGRVDRDDPADMEPCFHIPIDAFTPRPVI